MSTPVAIPQPQQLPHPQQLPPAPPPRRGRALAAVLASGVVLLCAVQAYGQMTARTTTTTREFDGPLETVRALTGTGDLEVRALEGLEGARVRTTLYGGASTPRASAELTGGELRLEGDCSRSAWPFPCSVSFVVEVPAGTSLDFRTGTGDLSLDGRLGALDADLGTGGVTWLDAEAEVARVSTSTGDVEVRGDVAELVAASSTGDVEAEFTSPPRSVDVRLSTGDVTILVPDDPAVRYATDVATATGDVTAAVPVDSLSDRRMYVRTATGDVEVLP